MIVPCKTLLEHGFNGLHTFFAVILVVVFFERFKLGRLDFDNGLVFRICVLLRDFLDLGHRRFSVHEPFARLWLRRVYLARLHIQLSAWLWTCRVVLCLLNILLTIRYANALNFIKNFVAVWERFDQTVAVQFHYFFVLSALN